MFSIPTFPKFIILLAVIAIVYMWTRRNAVQSRGGQGAGQNSGRSGNQQGASRPTNAARNPAANAKQKAIEDLVKCPSCGTYIAAGSHCDCGQGRR